MKLHFMTDLSLMKQIAGLKELSLDGIDDTELLSAAEKNKISLEQQWQKYAAEIEKKLQNIVKSEWQDLDVQIFVFPDNIKIGACNCEEHKILFGYREEYPGFGLITICHEIVHMLIYKYRKQQHISRLADEIFVFLSAECELRKKLFGKEYFVDFFSGPLSPFHQEALAKSRLLVSSWQAYLLDKNISCKGFLEFIEKNITTAEKNEYNAVKLKDFIGEHK